MSRSGKDLKTELMERFGWSEQEFAAHFPDAPKFDSKTGFKDCVFQLEQHRDTMRRRVKDKKP